MKALQTDGRGKLLVGRVDPPEPGPDDVLVRVRACALNRADIGMLDGQRHGDRGGPGTVLGTEWAGDVESVGSNVTNFQPGDRVMGSGAAAFAEYAVAHAGRVHRIPAADMGYAEASTLPVALQTMHDAVVTHGHAGPGSRVLIQGASSGVGLMGLQIARFVGSALVVGTASNAGRRARLQEFGAHAVLDPNAENWCAATSELTEGRGFDVIVDMLSGPFAQRNLEAAAVLGRIVNVGRLAGERAELDLDLHAAKRITYVGVTFRSRTPEETREINRKMQAQLGDAIASRKLALPVDRRFSFDDAATAFMHMRANGHLGKIVLEIGTPQIQQEKP